MELPDVPANVRAELARRKDRSQTGLRTHLGISRVSMWRRLNGEVPFNVDELAKVADYLDIPVAVLFDGSNRASA